MEETFTQTPAKAYRVFLQYVWRQGGGLPVLVDTEQVGEVRVGSQRMLNPGSLLEEITLLEPGSRVEYTVAEWGLLSSLSNHTASVTFAPEGAAGTRMVWEVGFDAPELRGFWQAFTDNNIRTAVANFSNVMGQDELVVVVEEELGVAPARAVDTFLDYTWRQGGDFQGPPPTIISDGGANGELITRVVQPVGLVERICSVVRHSPSHATVEYKIDNPGFFTLFPVALHAGVVEFRDEGSGATCLTWTVKCLPLPGCAFYVESLIRFVISTLTANLRSKVTSG